MCPLLRYFGHSNRFTTMFYRWELIGVGRFKEAGLQVQWSSSAMLKDAGVVYIQTGRLEETAP